MAGSLPQRGPSQGIFRKDGEYWTVGWEERVFRLKDTKGFAYLAHLLRHPATEFHALDLVGGIAHHREDDESTGPDAELETAGIHVATSDDAGEMLDAQAKATYRHWLAELHEELDAAKALGHVGRAEVAERDIAILTSELSRAVGLHGRTRRATSASERARQSVTKTIRAVIDRIAQNDAALGDELSRSIRTGAFCSYEPDPPIAWEFGPTDPEPGGAPVPDAGSPPSEAPPAVLGVSLFSLAERTRFVGRESERATIRGAIARALEGQGSLVMLAGGPGVGKTRLASLLEEPIRPGRAGPDVRALPVRLRLGRDRRAVPDPTEPLKHRARPRPTPEPGLSAHEDGEARRPARDPADYPFGQHQRPQRHDRRVRLPAAGERASSSAFCSRFVRVCACAIVGTTLIP
jgi:hypothetical protein